MKVRETQLGAAAWPAGQQVVLGGRAPAAQLDVGRLLQDSQRQLAHHIQHAVEHLCQAAQPPQGAAWWVRPGQPHLALLASVSAALPPGGPPAASDLRRQEADRRKLHNTRRTARRDGGSDASGSGAVVCIEVTRGRGQRVYRGRGGADQGWEGFDMTDDLVSGWAQLVEVGRSYLLPQGFPDSVAPQYARYMAWRGAQYFFGGAMSVFTTRSLLGALGVAGRHGGEAAAAINWVLKDGAGRLGRFLFARWGRSLDCELKQFRLGGDLLMQTAAALELATAAAPRSFLPLACSANLAKNLAAVAASSTRAPIYRTFALQNNLADVTAKGESVANLADIAGTICGIMLARAVVPVVPTFCLLSVGYLFASRREVDSVELPYLNRARLAYAARAFLAQGSVPSIKEANANEALVPWGPGHRAGHRVVLGARVEDACSGPSALTTALAAAPGRRFALAYRPDTGKAYVMLLEGAQTLDVLAGAFQAHVLLHLLDSSRAGTPAAEALPQQLRAAPPARLPRWPEPGGQQVGEGGRDWEACLARARQQGGPLFDEFVRQASSAGWRPQLTMLNPRETRLLPLAGATGL